MPIYEFFCPDCFTVFSFFSPTTTPAARPACPKCGRADLERRPSRFATPRNAGGGDSEGDEELFPGLDDAKMEGAFESLAREMEGLDESAESDPRTMARMLRRFSEATGLEPGPKILDMLARLDRGEDPEALDEEMGDEGDDDLADLFRRKGEALRRRLARPRVDETLYFL
jgi:putative FmdB family regulatory protein